jgi:hypothetical protein
VDTAHGSDVGDKPGIRLEPLTDGSQIRELLVPLTLQGMPTWLHGQDFVVRNLSEPFLKVSRCPDFDSSIKAQVVDNLRSGVRHSVLECVPYSLRTSEAFFYEACQAVAAVNFFP